MATSLAEIRAKLAASEGKRDGNTQSQGDNAIYAHWNIDEGATARIRFLPDADTKNTFFWVERAMIRLPFAGVKGQGDSKPVLVQVPCMEMYGKDTPCPILAEVRGWFKDPNLEEMGRKYWKKRSYLFQGLVRENPMSNDKTPENPIRRFVISPQIFNLVKSALMDPELENLPTDYQGGLDFSVVKTSKGGYADYSTSKWARKESALSGDEMQAIEQYGLYNLNDFLPKKPGEVELRVIKEMFEASVNGEAYDPERFGSYFRPAGMQFESSSNSAPAAQSAPAPRPAPVAVAAPAAQPAPWEADAAEAAESIAPVAAPTVAGGGKRAEDILAMIRNRQK
tara:strand:+ start:4638 stop:5654 length:1017 start_codon:yes stop_codon:yes gene_type:complete